MDTRVIKVSETDPEEELLQEAAEILRRGGLVAFPTETVYGLGADGLNANAVKNIFHAKGRPSDNPLILHIADIESLKALTFEVSDKAKIVMKAFWPGPLTIILPRSLLVPNEVTAGLSTVGIRYPSHPIAQKLLQVAKIPVAAPSANLSGKPSPTEGKHVIKDLMGRVDMIIEGGPCAFGLESTILDMTSEIPMILRPGAITIEMLRSVLGQVEMDPAIEKNSTEDFVAKAPGMKYRHYAPRAVMMIVNGRKEDVVAKIQQLTKEYISKGEIVGIMATEETKGEYHANYVQSVGSRKAPEQIAKNIFRVLREFDELPVEVILAEGYEKKEIGTAIMNRLSKAAGYRMLYV